MKNPHPFLSTKLFKFIQTTGIKQHELFIHKGTAVSVNNLSKGIPE